MAKYKSILAISMLIVFGGCGEDADDEAAYRNKVMVSDKVILLDDKESDILQKHLSRVDGTCNQKAGSPYLTDLQGFFSARGIDIGRDFKLTHIQKRDSMLLDMPREDTLTFTLQLGAGGCANSISASSSPKK